MQNPKISYLIVCSRNERVKTKCRRVGWFSSQNEQKYVLSRVQHLCASHSRSCGLISRFWFLHFVSKHFNVVYAQCEHRFCGRLEDNELLTSGDLHFRRLVAKCASRVPVRMGTSPIIHELKTTYCWDTSWTGWWATRVCVRTSAHICF